MPAAIDGKWYIYYKGSYAWSHFEAPQAKGVTGINEWTERFDVYPNPFRDEISIEINGREIQKIELYNTLGQLLDIFNGEKLATSQLTITMNYPGNTFIIKIYENNRITNQIVIKE
jgi:hypothetical protein